ncbi:MAG: hypothetical protein JXN65_08450 [Clostridia bacterium]|nr:hypothetical protein [Clostridia bacterium]
MLSVFLFALGLSACMATPDNQVVIPKSNTEQEIIKSAEENKDTDRDFIYEAPNHIAETFVIVQGHLDIKVDADVNVPDIDHVPVAKITTDPFKQERVEELIEYFLEDGILINGYVPTKEYYDERILDARRGYLVDGEYVFDESSEEWLAQLLEERDKAPAEDIKEPIDFYMPIEDEYFSCRIQKDEQIIGNFRVNGDWRFLYYNEANYREADRNYYNYETAEQIILSEKEINMTEKEAIKAAQKIFIDLGIEGMEVSEIKKIYYTENEDIYGEIKYGGYSLTFMRGFSGMMPLNIKNCGMSQWDAFEVSPPVEVEIMKVDVDENGNVTSFLWQNPIRIVDIFTDHVDILPFDDIMERFREFSKLQFGYTGSMDDMQSIYEFYKIDLKLVYLPLKNNPVEFMYAPCWVFTYKQRVEYTQEQIDWYESNGGYIPQNWDDLRDSYLIFSAVDGASVSSYSTSFAEKAEKTRKELGYD